MLFRAQSLDCVNSYGILHSLCVSIVFGLGLDDYLRDFVQLEFNFEINKVIYIINFNTTIMNFFLSFSDVFLDVIKKSIWVGLDQLKFIRVIPVCLFDSLFNLGLD